MNQGTRSRAGGGGVQLFVGSPGKKENDRKKGISGKGSPPFNSNSITKIKGGVGNRSAGKGPGWAEKRGEKGKGSRAPRSRGIMSRATELGRREEGRSSISREFSYFDDQKWGSGKVSRRQKRLWKVDSGLVD